VTKFALNADLVHLFVTLRARHESTIALIRRTLKANGMVWVSWPKKASEAPTDITEDTIRTVALPMGLVDVKVCAFDKTWSGLKLMIRKTMRLASVVTGNRIL